MKTIGITRISLAFMFMVSLSSVVHAEAPIELRHAELLRTETDAGGATRYLDGNVWIVQDTLSITSDHAIYHEIAGLLLFNGRVHFVEPHRQIWADSAVYYAKDGRATAMGRVRIEQDSITVTCGKVIYYEAREEASFFDDVHLYSLKENATLTGDLGAYNRRKDYGIINQNPRLVRRFTDTDSLVVRGRVVEYFFSKRSATVTDSVHILRNDFEAWGDKLFYYDESDWTRLIGHPNIQRGRETLKADTVDVYFEAQRVRRLVLRQNGLALSPVDSLLPEPQNRVTGRTMEVTFREGEMDSIHVQGNATSLYYIREKTDNNGANVISGDQMDMWIHQGQIAWIRVEGGTEGTYFPQRLENLARTETSGLPSPIPNPRP